MTKSILKLLALVVVASFVLTGCTTITPSQSSDDSNTVVATFDGGQILKGDATTQLSYLQDMYSQYGYSTAFDDPTQALDLKRQLLQYMVQTQIVKNKAKEQTR